MNLQCHNPEFLWLLLFLPLLAWLNKKWGRPASLTFSSTALAASVGRRRRTWERWLLWLLRLPALGLLIIALARPQIGKGSSQIESSGIDIVLAVDLSSSMLALDFTEGRDHVLTRLDAVKKVVAQFIKERPNDRIGLVAFAQHPYLVSPLTLKHDWLERNLERLEVGLIEDGTAIGSALMMSLNRLRDLPAKSRVIILLTDGENNSGKVSPVAAAEAAAAYATKVYTIAAGRSGWVPTYVLDNTNKLARDHRGQLRIDRTHRTVDVATLKKIAETTGGAFFLAPDLKQLHAIYKEIDGLEKTEVTIRHSATYEECFSWFVISGLVLLVIEQFLRHTRFRAFL